MTEIIDLSPDPRSHIKTLSRIGYTFNSAVADVLDNSIAADASRISIFSPPGQENPFVSINDNGHGMGFDELINNMRIGCKDPDYHRSDGDLGRFGSGMKTASFSQARQLTVISKRRGEPRVAARWDLDEIDRTNTWSLQVFSDGEFNEIEGFDAAVTEHHGTQVIWHKLTFIEHGSHALDSDSELAAKLHNLSKHVALYFHRFMTGANSRIFELNGAPIAPTDPFAESEPGYQEGPSSKMRCKGGHILIKTHVLPLIQNMTPELLSKLGGASGITQAQGIYLYREKRLIIAGGWLGMGRSTQLGALARVQVDIPSTLDAQWSTDVKKESLEIPARVKSSLKKFMADPVKRSKKVYNYKGKIEVVNKYWRISEDENNKVITYQIDPENSALKSTIENLKPENRLVFLNYLKHLSATLPINHIYEKMSERPKDVSQEEEHLKLIDELIAQAFGS